MKFRKKPIVVDAFRWSRNGDHPDDNILRPYDDTGTSPLKPREGAVVRYFRHPKVPGTDYHKEAYGLGCGFMFYDHGFIETLEGGHMVCPGDWIITGVNGERYPCKPDIFDKTYEAVQEPEGKP